MSEGIHDDLYARTIILDNSYERIIIVSTDLLFITKELREAIVDEISKKARGMKVDASHHLLVAATHTHSGTGAYVDNWVFEFAALGSYEQEIFAHLAKQISLGILKAWKNLSPAKLGIGRGLALDLNHNRRRKGGPTDKELGIIRIDRVDDNPIAYLINFAAHPTLLGPKNMLISADYPGQLAKKIEKNGPLVIFLNGALGDQTPYRPHGHEGFEKIEKYGELLSNNIRPLAAGIKTSSSIKLRALDYFISLPNANLRGALGIFSFLFNRLADYLFIPDITILQLILIDDALLVAMPCEPGTETGLDLKTRLESQGFRYPWIVAPANDYIGYIIEEGDYRRGGYEARASFYGPKMATWFKERILEMVPWLLAGNSMLLAPQ